MKIHASKMIIHCLVMVFCLYALKGSATNYYSDPSAAGSMTNPGTFNAPWASLSSIFSANKTFLAGDTIFLRSGNHGYAIIKGVNSGYVVITPQPGENPVISRIRISNAATTAAASRTVTGKRCGAGCAARIMTRFFRTPISIMRPGVTGEPFPAQDAGLRI